ncbi:hypothetical protein H4R34_001199 [Dimargaris verticillata]|uniref:Uncharacterized protein n=1 Tax=Dimargaris verticillata TaxID=2761393 RepID=A0A9W8EEQ2_9FUNG|nr:hypothetical protein H4R34_001199 [Dimargaris verticillata]
MTLENKATVPNAGHIPLFVMDPDRAWPQHIDKLFESMIAVPEACIAHLFQESISQYQSLNKDIQDAIGTILLIIPHTIRAMASLTLLTKPSQLTVHQQREVNMQFPQALYHLLNLTSVWKRAIVLFQSSIPSCTQELAPTLLAHLAEIKRTGLYHLNLVGQEVLRVWCHWQLLASGAVISTMAAMLDNQQAYITIYNQFQCIAQLFQRGLGLVVEAHRIAQCPPLALDYLSLLGSSSAQSDIGSRSAPHIAFAMPPMVPKAPLFRRCQRSLWGTLGLQRSLSLGMLHLPLSKPTSVKPSSTAQAEQPSPSPPAIKPALRKRLSAPFKPLKLSKPTSARFVPPLTRNPWPPFYQHENNSAEVNLFSSHGVDRLKARHVEQQSHQADKWQPKAPGTATRVNQWMSRAKSAWAELRMA